MLVFGAFLRATGAGPPVLGVVEFGPDEAGAGDALIVEWYMESQVLGCSMSPSVGEFAIWELDSNQKWFAEYSMLETAAKVLVTRLLLEISL